MVDVCEALAHVAARLSPTSPTKVVPTSLGAHLVQLAYACKGLEGHGWDGVATHAYELRLQGRPDVADRLEALADKWISCRYGALVVSFCA
jgi:hypothetical protein